MIQETEHIRDLSIEQEMKDSFLSFAVSVIMDRALPDVRDGLKPSQRRILVAMNDLNLGPRSKHRKCAKITGDTSGNYHPHGAEQIYPTLVRMAQEFSLRYPLVDKQGNFGSVDGDPPAAMRYTEARMSEIATLMLEDLDRDTVDFRPNYDETRTEPTVLPGKFPNLLANGATGIAIGMATSIPPQNLTEICDALIKLIDQPEVPDSEILKIVKGPDFPTGGLICGRSGIRDAYQTGRGRITVRARVHTEQTRGGKTDIVVTEIPYMVNKSTIKERIAELVNAGKITGIADLRDESDREGMRLVIEMKRGEDSEVVLNQLYKHTPLQDTFSCNMLALVDGRPRTMSLVEMLKEFKRHRFDVIVRRTRFLLARAEERAHLLEGFLIALDHIDAVIDTIRKSSDVPTARTRLMERFKLSEVQAEAILRMQLQRLTGLEREKIEQEYKELKEKIDHYRAVLADERLVYDIIREDVYEIREKHGDARRTEIVGEIGEIDIEDLIAEENVAVTISHAGYIKRMPLSSYRKQGRGGKGVIGGDTREGDFIERLIIAGTHDYFLFFTDLGRVYWQKVYDIPQMGRTARGRAIINLLSLQKDENITALIPVRSFDEGNLIMATVKGVVKKTELSAYGNPKRGGIIAINLDRGDKLVGVRLNLTGDDVVMVTCRGKAIRFADGRVRAMGRATRGVRGIKLVKGDRVVDIVTVSPNTTLLTACENGFGKRSSFDDYPRRNRGGQGIIDIKTSERNGDVVAARDVHEADDLMMITSSGMIIRTPVADVSLIGRNTQGVRLIRLEGEDRLVSVAPVAEEEPVAEGEAPESDEIGTDAEEETGEEPEQDEVEPEQEEI